LDLIVEPRLLPGSEDLRFAAGQSGLHREIRLWQQQGVFVIHRAFRFGKRAATLARASWRVNAATRTCGKQIKQCGLNRCHGVNRDAQVERLLPSPPRVAIRETASHIIQRPVIAADGLADHAVLEATRGALRGWAQIDRGTVIRKQLTIHLGHPPPYDATITGRVRDVGGGPLGDAVVRAAPSAYYSTAPTVVATTGSGGRFTIAGVDRAAYDVSADAADHLAGVRAHVSGGSRNVELVLDAGLPLAGQVVDRRGEPVPSFTLTVQRREGRARALVETVAVVDPQGRFGVRVARGDYDLVASVPDQVRAAVHAAAGATDVRIVIGTGVTLRGRVISSDDGTPIGGAFVGPETADSSLKSQAALPVASTRADGTFELTGMAAGPIALEVRARGYAPAREQLPDAGDGAAIGPITIELTSGGPFGTRGPDIAGIGVNVISEGEVLRVVAVLPNSGAVDAGLGAGDLIISVDDQPVSTLGVDGAIARLRGPPGTSVTLTVRRDGHDSRRSVERRRLPG
jgi:hypothetical protein